MNTELVEIQPQELKFIFELKKQSSCSIRLVNKSNHYVAFKVKTTSPKKYCVRPNTGVIEPKSTCDFTVTMQAQRVPPPDLVCKDKFLVQSTAVPKGTAEEDITPITFVKEDGKYVEEKKLKVILVSPPQSPVLSPINQTSNEVQNFEAISSKDEIPCEGQTCSPPAKINEHVWESTKASCEDLEPIRDTESTAVKDFVELRLAKDVEEMKSKLKELESKLSKAEVTISKLTEERRLSTQERLSLQEELEVLRTKRVSRKRVQAGFPLLFVCMVALVSLYLGYHLRNQ